MPVVRELWLASSFEVIVYVLTVVRIILPLRQEVLEFFQLAGKVEVLYYKNSTLPYNSTYLESTSKPGFAPRSPGQERRSRGLIFVSGVRVIRVGNS